MMIMDYIMENKMGGQFTDTIPLHYRKASFFGATLLTTVLISPENYVRSKQTSQNVAPSDESRGGYGEILVIQKYSFWIQDMTMGQNLWCHIWVDEHPFSIYFDVQ